MVRSYSREREIDQVFLQTVRNWISEHGEVFVMFRYLEAGGARDCALFNTFDAFEHLIAMMPIGTDIVVNQYKQLGFRDRVNDSFINQAKDIVPDGREYLFVQLDSKDSRGCFLHVYEGDSHEDMIEELSECQGQNVAFGVYPPCGADDGEFIISRSVGGIDGAR